MFNRNLIITLVLLVTILASCSIVKSPTATNNFKRVKYRAHLNLHKQKQSPKLTVTSFEEDDKRMETKTETYAKNQTFASLSKLNSNSYDKLDHTLSKQKAIAQNNLETAALNFKFENVLQQAITDGRAIDLDVKTNASLSRNWWESDPEDWPWKELVLATILVLLVILAAILLIQLLGALLGSILGLVILLVLIYFLVDYLA